MFEDELNKKNDNGESLLQKGAPIDLGKEAAMEAEVRKYSFYLQNCKIFTDGQIFCQIACF